MYCDLRELYRWSSLKRGVIDYMVKCLTCPQWVTPGTSKKDSVWVIVDRLTKSAHFLPICTDYYRQKLRDYMGYQYRLFQIRVIVLHLSFERCCMSLSVLDWTLLGGVFPLADFAYNNNIQLSIQMTPYDALYGQMYHKPLCWTELGEKKMLGHIWFSTLRKSYVDLKRKDIKFIFGDRVLRFNRKDKLSPMFIRPYTILKRVGLVVYQLELLLELDYIHDVFHVYMLRWYRSNPSHVVPIKEIEVRPDLSFNEPVQILEHEVKFLRKEWISLVKVFWKNHSTKGATWELEDSIHQ
ncbi:DNA/RNA polymerases superfamily protein [Gossypium australe]|uniref:DNA/RNA polymerases superfamily protein n=1 Tax=Gossypium australe TaxID=47621 RepID=A0A5B6U6M5_9ROSI|nr:DNA/RNA polymerases superfamily protein [Gossypium australe]